MGHSVNCEDCPFLLYPLYARLHLCPYFELWVSIVIYTPLIISSQRFFSQTIVSLYLIWAWGLGGLGGQWLKDLTA
jgi:hypothetical protein